jgi:Protein of unknown function (DUF3168)
VRSPILVLRAAILARCADDEALLAAMGGSLRFHDEPPRAAEGVYAVFGEARAKDWSTGSDEGHDQDPSIAVWSKPGGSRAALRAADRIAALLHEAPLALDGHRLVSLRVAAVETARVEKANLARVTLRLRALTEVL